ncbi:MAG: hypothetical protein K2N89_02830 [Lachnospiraceae bacterium]|nr:hypothetical protein [Lachnospiraceae bacterium]
MLKIKNKVTKRILALALSGAMIASSLTTSGLTAYAVEDSQNTPSGYSEEISDTDNETAQTEEAEENEGNKNAENPDDAQGEKDSEESAKTEPSKPELDKKEPVKTESVKEDSTEKEEAKSTDDEDRERDEKQEDVKASTYSAPSASTKSNKWPNYEVFRGSVFGYSSYDVTNTAYYNLGNKNGNMWVSALGKPNKISGDTDGRAMYFYQVPIGKSFELRAKATINEIGKGESSDSQVGFGLMARDDMLIDEKCDGTTYTNGAGFITDYVAAGTLMGSTQNTVSNTSINCFSRKDGELIKGGSLGEGKIVAAGETYDLSLTFDGTKYICQIGGYDPVPYSIPLNKIDSKYQYIGMFASRHADITFSDIYLIVDGKRILDQVSTRYSVTVSKEGNGTVKASETSVVAGDTVTLTAKPGNGYYFDDWQIVEGTGLETNIEINENDQFTMPKGNVSIKAIFKEIPTEWDFEKDSALSALVEGKKGKVAGLEIDATNGTFDSRNSLTTGWAQISEGTTITVPLPGECTLTVVGEDANYTVDGEAAEKPEVSFTCGGIFLKTAVITATADTGIKCITVTSSGKEEIVLPETPRKIDVWDFGAKEQSGSNYVNNIKAADWNTCSALINGALTPAEDTSGELTFGDLTMFYNNKDRIYSSTASNSYHKFQTNGTIPTQGAYNYGDYTAAGEWYCNGAGGSGQRYVTIKNVVAGDLLCAYVGVSNAAEKYVIEYCGADGTQEGVVEATESVAKDTNKKITFIAQHSGVYKIWTENVATGKPLYNRIVRYPAVGVQGTIDWAGISREGLSIQFVNDTTEEATNAVFDSTGYAVILAPGYTYTARLVGNSQYAFTDDSGTIELSSAAGVNGKTHNLVVQDLEALHEVSGKFIGSGEIPLTGVNATKLVFKNIDNDDTCEAQIADDAYRVSLKKGTYVAEITADKYSTRTHVIVKNASVVRDLFLASTDTSPLPLVKDLYVKYPEKEENNFPTINAALRAAKRMNPEKEEDRITIHINPGTYREQVFVNTNYITLVNDSSTQDVTITWYYGIGYAYYSADDSGGKGTGYYNEESAYDKFEKHNAARWGCAVRVKATDFKAKNIIFENSFNRYITDEELEDGVALSTEGAGTEISFKRTASVTPTQAASKTATERAAALALDTGSDRSEFYNCEFYSSQDTLYTGDENSRAYYKDCLISGNTDYIFGDGNQVFEDCELKWQGYTSGANGGHITAAKDKSSLGYLFYNCKITKNKTSGFSVVAGTLGRTWGAGASVTYVNTVQEASNLISDSGWANMNGDPKKANYKEYNTRLENGTEINHNTSPRKDIYVTEDPTKKAETGIKAYFGEDWKPTFYDWSTEGGGDEESSSDSGSSETNPPNPSEPGSDPSEPESESESSESDNDRNEDIYIRGLESSYDYTGAKIIPDIEVWDGNTRLSPDIDYKVTYKNNVKPGTDTAKVIVTGKGNYAGKSLEKSFSIKDVELDKIPADFLNLKGAKIDRIPDQPYDIVDGKAKVHYPDFVLTTKGEGKTTVTTKYVYKNGEYKAEDTDTKIAANVAISNNVNKGTATILITGAKDAKNKATTVKKTFKITAVDLSKAADDVLSVDVEEATTYAVSGAIPKVTVKYKNMPLISGKDYTLKCANNKKAGEQTATVTITGKGNYAKKYAPVKYTIKPLNLSKLEINAVTAVAGGKPDKIKATINDRTGTALKASQYTLSVYRDEKCENAYTAADRFEASRSIYVVAKAKEGSKDLEGETTPKAFQVGTIDISKAKVVSAVDGKVVTKEYTGKPIELTGDDLKVTLKVNGKEEKLTLGQDYKIVTHFNNINKGSATVVLQGMGSNGYSGTKTYKFKITQKSVKDLKTWEEMLDEMTKLMNSIATAVSQ